MEQRDTNVLRVCGDLIRTAALFRKELDKHLAHLGLSGPQFGILSQLQFGGKTRLSELGKRLWVSGGNVTGLVDRLVKAGYVKRIRMHTDRRVIFAELTERGRELVAELQPLHRACMLELTDGLEDEDLRNLHVLLGKIQSPVMKEGD